MSEEQIKELIGDLNCEAVNRYIYRKCKEHEKWWFKKVEIKFYFLYSLIIFLLLIIAFK